MSGISCFVSAPSSPVLKSGVVTMQQHRLKASVLSPLKTLPPCCGGTVPQKQEGSWWEVFWTTLYLWNGGINAHKNVRWCTCAKLIVCSSEAEDCFLLHSGLFFYLCFHKRKDSNVLTLQFNFQSSKTNSDNQVNSITCFEAIFVTLDTRMWSEKEREFFVTFEESIMLFVYHTIW